MEEKGLKFLILFFYYNRPVLAKAPIQALLESTYKNFEVAFIDDSDDFVPGFDLFSSMVGKDTRFSYHHTGDTKEAKLARGGSLFGNHANQIMLNSKADIGLMNCDDDIILPTYLEKLNNFYSNCDHIDTSYCDVIIYDPLVDDWREKAKEPATADHFLNTNHEYHSMMNSKDASQGSWRLDCVRVGGLRFQSPQTVAIDAFFYNDLANTFGFAKWNGITGQLKAFSECQLGRHQSYDRVD